MFLTILKILPKKYIQRKNGKKVYFPVNFIIIKIIQYPFTSPYEPHENLLYVLPTKKHLQVATKFCPWLYLNFVRRPSSAH